MKNSKSDEMQINISVVGLAGSDTVKGISGVGKSCLCNRLAQPGSYKPKHVSTISSIDFYGSTFNQSHWLYWSHIDKEIKGRKYKFHFIEQTVFIDDSSFREFRTNSEPQDFIKRASMTELRINKKAYLCRRPTTTSDEDNFSLHSVDDKMLIHLFILVFDVSDVEKRNARSQETIFKQLFDSILAAKKPLIVATTKNDAASPSVLERLRAIIDKRPYNKHPVVETSAKLDVNVAQIYELAVGLCDGGARIARQALVSYADGVAQRDRDDDELRQAFLGLVGRAFADRPMAAVTWDEFGGGDDVALYRRRFPLDELAALFTRRQTEALQERRAANNRRCKEALLALLQRCDDLIWPEER